MDCTLAADENVVVEYEKRKKDIGKLQEEMNKCEASLDNHHTDVHEVGIFCPDFDLPWAS